MANAWYLAKSNRIIPSPKHWHIELHITAQKNLDAPVEVMGVLNLPAVPINLN